MVHVGQVWYPAVHIDRFGAFIVPQVSGPVPSSGVSAQVQINNNGASAVTATDYAVRVNVFEMDGSTPVTNCTMRGTGSILAGASVVLKCSLPIVGAGLKLWSVQHPVQYAAVVVLEDVTGQATDSKRWTTGFRTAEFTADHGLSINGEPMSFRGFSHHDSFGGCGVAMPPRIDLYVAVYPDICGDIQGEFRITHCVRVAHEQRVRVRACVDCPTAGIGRRLVVPLVQTYGACRTTRITLRCMTFSTRLAQPSGMKTEILAFGTCPLYLYLRLCSHRPRSAKERCLRA
jgi:hypothetical protein